MYDINFTKRLNEILKDNNMKQSQLVEKTDIPQPTISDYVNGKKTPSMDNACKLAVALGVSLDWLCGLKTMGNTQTSDSANILLYMVDIIEDNNGILKMAVDVVEEFDVEGRLEYGEHYSAAICTKDFRFRNFINEYRRAIDAGNNAKSEYKLDEKIAESMKKAVIDKYINIFQDNGSDKL